MNYFSIKWRWHLTHEEKQEEAQLLTFTQQQNLNRRSLHSNWTVLARQTTFQVTKWRRTQCKRRSSNRSPRRPKVKSRRERHLDGDWDWDILLIFDYVFLCSFSLKHLFRNEWKISIGAKNSWNLNKFQSKFTLHSSLHFGSFWFK